MCVIISRCYLFVNSGHWRYLQWRDVTSKHHLVCSPGLGLSLVSCHLFLQSPVSHLISVGSDQSASGIVSSISIVIIISILIKRDDTDQWCGHSPAGAPTEGLLHHPSPDPGQDKDPPWATGWALLQQWLTHQPAAERWGLPKVPAGDEEDEGFPWLGD